MFYHRVTTKAVKCSDGSTYPTALPNWHWEVLDLLKKHEWCGAFELEDEAQAIYFKPRDEYEMSFQALLMKIIEWDYETFAAIEDGHCNQNAQEQLLEPFPAYLQAQVRFPFGLPFDELIFKVSSS